jgi:hypothetical protein
LGSAVSEGNFATHDLWLRNYRCTWKWRWQSDPHALRLRQACGRRPWTPRAHVPGCTPFFERGGGPKAACRSQPFLPIVSSLYIFCASCPVPLPLAAQNRTWWWSTVKTTHLMHVVNMGGLDQTIGSR